MSRERPRVVASLTTIPTRLRNLEAIVACLDRQTLAVDRIHLWLCPYYARLSRTLSRADLPEYLARHPRVEIGWVEDWGPVTKLYPAIERYAGTDTTILVLDDDRLFPADAHRQLVDWTQTLQAPCGFRGKSFSDARLDYARMTVFGSCPEDTARVGITRPERVDILTGTGSIAFPAHALDADFLAFWRRQSADAQAMQRLTDDIWINGYLAMRSVPRYVVPASDLTPMTIDARLPGMGRGLLGRAMRTLSTPRDSLWLINRGNDYNDRSIEHFRAYWRQGAAAGAP